MRFKKPVVALSVVALFALAACGGSDDGGGSSSDDSIDKENLGNTGSGVDPNREGPVEIEGAEEGGTVKVLTATGLTTPIDPSDLYYVDTNAIMTGLVTRQLTQYAYDEETGQMILVPDLATDLGTPSADFKEWTFTLRDGVKWENGDPITPEEVQFGIVRSMDDKTFVNGPGLYYSTPYFKGGGTYKGPYTDPSGMDGQEAVTIDGNEITIHMQTPFPDFPYYASFPAMGPIPLGKASDPATYAQRPWASGPYKIKDYTIAKTLVLERNDQWDPATDPARTQYPDGYEFKAGVQSDQIDQILLADSGDGQVTMTYDDVQGQNFRKFQTEAEDRLVLGGSPCTFFNALDNRTITDKAVREAYLWAYPYNDVIIASGLIKGVTAIPATNLMPPGIPEREEYNPVEGHGPFQTDPEKAKQLLKESGNENYEIKFYFRTDNDTNVKSKDVVVKALNEAGFKATPIATTEADYVEDRDDPNGPVNVRAYGWCSDWPSGATWIPPIFGSTDIAEVGFGTNESAYSNPDVDKAIADTLQLPAQEQHPEWNALDKQIMTEDLPLVPQWYTGVAQAHGSRINGHYDDTTLGAPTFRNIWITQS